MPFSLTKYLEKKDSRQRMYRNLDSLGGQYKSPGKTYTIKVQ